eukprot:4239893-Amphidinium_carterae.2
MVYGIHDDPNVPIYGHYILHNEEKQTKHKAAKPKTLQQHLPYTNWREFYAKGKSKQQYHKKGGLKQQSITQVDYTFRGKTTTTKLRSTKEGSYTRLSQSDQTVHCGEWTTEYDTTIRLTSVTGYSGEIPSDDLCTTADYKMPSLQRRQRGQQEHQLTQLLNHMLNRSVWLPNRFLRHAEGKTSYKRNWQRPYTQPILKLGEKVYIDNLMAENNKLYQRNSQQKHEAMWIGRYYYRTPWSSGGFLVVLTCVT